MVTLNLWNEQGPHEARLRLVTHALRALAPNVVALQEVRERQPEIPNQATTLASELGMHCTFASVATWGDGTEGLALLVQPSLAVEHHNETLLPDPEKLGPRRALALTLKSTAGTIAVVTTHLAYQLAAGRTREAQVVALDTFAKAQTSDAVRIVCGDLNAAPDTDEIRFLRGATTLEGKRTFWQDAFSRAHPGELGHTWSSQNAYAATQAQFELDRRIDYILVSPRRKDGRSGIIDARVVLNEPKDSVFPSDHFGVLADIEI